MNKDEMKAECNATNQVTLTSEDVLKLLQSAEVMAEALTFVAGKNKYSHEGVWPKVAKALERWHSL